jgi:hypothetical protein
VDVIEVRLLSGLLLERKVVHIVSGTAGIHGGFVVSVLP